MGEQAAIAARVAGGHLRVLAGGIVRRGGHMRRFVSDRRYCVYRPRRRRGAENRRHRVEIPARGERVRNRRRERGHQDRKQSEPTADLPLETTQDSLVDMMKAVADYATLINACQPRERGGSMR